MTLQGLQMPNWRPSLLLKSKSIRHTRMGVRTEYAAEATIPLLQFKSATSTREESSVAKKEAQGSYPSNPKRLLVGCQIKRSFAGIVNRTLPVHRRTWQVVWLRVPVVGLTCPPSPEGRAAVSSARRGVLRMVLRPLRKRRRCPSSNSSRRPAVITEDECGRR